MRLNAWWVMAALAATAATASGQERTITEAQLPRAVAATAARETHGSVVKAYTTERENGRREYEAETMVNGRSRDISIAEDGTLIEVEQQVEMNALPPQVRDAIAAKARGAKIMKVESLEKQGALVAYEAGTLKNGHRGEIQVGPHGEALVHEE